MIRKGCLRDFSFEQVSEEEGNVFVHISRVIRDLSFVKFDRTAQDKRVATMTDRRDVNKPFSAKFTKMLQSFIEKLIEKNK